MADIEKLWEYACNGNIDALKEYYEEGGSVNNRYFRCGEEHSLIMGAFRNNLFDTVEYLMSVGEEITQKEYERIKTEMKKSELLQRMVCQIEYNTGMNDMQMM